MRRLVEDFEQAHPPMARAMADLLLRGNVVLEEHELLEGSVGDGFEAFVLGVLEEHGTSREVFAATLTALSRLRDTIDHLDQLPP
ncbi:hypothetical protein [Variovorax sp. KK3]|uniref:hypothetical protein n=1 Tax=Variovorax sp. KK3 TaxID=1855728 RepID=UPI001C4DF5F4|nr:hypothetical protein [Variovorax sp. KK3]